jgi:hypothetical protein
MDHSLTGRGCLYVLQVRLSGVQNEHLHLRTRLTPRRKDAEAQSKTSSSASSRLGDFALKEEKVRSLQVSRRNAGAGASSHYLNSSCAYAISIRLYGYCSQSTTASESCDLKVFHAMQ